MVKGGNIYSRPDHDLSLATPPNPSSEGGLFASARDKRTFLYIFSLALDLLALVLGYACALQTRDAQWLSAGGHSILFIALPLFLMFEIARETQDAETLQNRLLGTKRALGALGATAFVIVGISFLFKVDEISRIGFAITFGTAAIFLIVSKIILDRVVKLVMGDVVVAKTDPPLISVPVRWVAGFRDARVVNWLQDVFPEAAGALGLGLGPKHLKLDAMGLYYLLY